MPETNDYVLGRNPAAVRRLDIQDIQFGEVSERLLDAIDIQPDDVVVELGVGGGGLTRRLLRRLGPGNVLRAVDRTPELLEHTRKSLAGTSPARLEAVLADASRPGDWLAGADVVLGRAVLHHIPWAEDYLGRLRGALKPGARVGFVEPEFRAMLGRIAVYEAAGRDDVSVLREWAVGICRFYEQSGVSPSIGATMGWALAAAGYHDVRWIPAECPTDATVVENLTLYYDEIRERYVSMGIMTDAEIDKQIENLRAIRLDDAPAVWGLCRVTAIT